MTKPIPTIYDVAAQAGVSISTVSRVLNAPEKVNNDTRNSVLTAIDQLGFVPKADARARALKANGRIGVITPYFTAPSFVQRLRGVAEALKQTRYELVIYTVYSAQNLRSYLETLPLTHYLDGLIILSLQFDDKFAQRLVDYQLPTVLVEYPHTVLNSVEIDDVAGGKLAGQYLVSQGHRSIGFVGDTTVPEYGIHPITQRLSGFRKALQAADISLLEQNLLLVPYDAEITHQKALAFLSNPDHPTAIFAATDLQAVGVIRAARELGLRIPQDIAVLGFDDLDLAEYVGLSTIRQHLDESGRIAAELLLSSISGKSQAIQHIQLPLEIVERETT